MMDDARRAGKGRSNTQARDCCVRRAGMPASQTRMQQMIWEASSGFATLHGHPGATARVQHRQGV